MKKIRRCMAALLLFLLVAALLISCADKCEDDGAELDYSGLDLDEQLRDELYLCFPQKLLCDENCEGLCPKCGKPKKDGPCGCPEKEIDPRLAVLKNFFDECEK